MALLAVENGKRRIYYLIVSSIGVDKETKKIYNKVGSKFRWEDEEDGEPTIHEWTNVCEHLQSFWTYVLLVLQGL